jgi:hypothetical protein
MRRFTYTQKDLQLEILKKWYPIGTLVGLGDGRYNCKIIEYVESATYWQVKVLYTNDGSIMDSYMSSTRNPLSLYISPDFEKQLKRQYKLDKLL